VVNASLTKTVLPAGFKDLEQAVNTGVPDRLPDGALRGAFVRLGQEIGVLPKGGDRRRLVLRGSGQVAVETMGLTLLICIIGLFLWQMVLTGFTYILAGHAAREGARELAVGSEVSSAVREDLPGAWREGVDVDEGSDYVEVTLAVPAIVPGFDTDFRVTVRAGTVIEGRAGPRSPPLAGGEYRRP
jgi:pilus assembly protein CpaE